MKAHNPANTKLLGLFGNPVSHSFSPLFMNRALELLGLNYRYMAFPIEDELLSQALNSLRCLGFGGVNITIPYKRIVMEYIDTIDENARRIGAVNCIVNRNGTLVGYNTDLTGFMKPLHDRAVSLQGRSAVMIGAGGAARAVCAALVENGIAEILILNRTEKNAHALMDWCSGTLNFIAIGYGGEGKRVAEDALQSFDLVINTTPVGMHPETDRSPLSDHVVFAPGQTVYDIVYNPWEPLLLQRAREHGARTINGFEMLIVQGLYSLVHWFPDHEEEIFSIQTSVVEFTRERVLQ
jgi:shikimate dehydrogenase